MLHYNKIRLGSVIILCFYCINLTTRQVNLNSCWIQVALAAYSDELEARFTDYEPNEMVNIDLTRYPSEAVLAVVRFAYINEVKLTRETVGPVWQVAAALGIRTIIGLCEEFLGQTTPNNAIYHYAIAEKFQLDDLSKKIYTFILNRYVLF